MRTVSSLMRTYAMTKIFSKLEGAMSVAALTVMFLCIALQVFCRYVLNNALEWPEEVARYAFICAVFLGASLAAQEGRHLEISVCKHSFGIRAYYALTIISTAFTLIFCAVMAVWGGKMVIFVAESAQVAASMSMPMYVVYLVIPLGMACMFFRAVNHVLAVLRRVSDHDAGQTGKRNALEEMSNSW